jgi:hypothetical protein
LTEVKFTLLKRFNGHATDLDERKVRADYLKEYNKGFIFILGFGLYYGGGGRALLFDASSFNWSEPTH